MYKVKKSMQVQSGSTNQRSAGLGLTAYSYIGLETNASAGTVQ